jgi:hypothetical protein
MPKRHNAASASWRGIDDGRSFVLTVCRRAAAAPIRFRGLGLGEVPAAARTHPRPEPAEALSILAGTSRSSRYNWFDFGTSSSAGHFLFVFNNERRPR